MTGMLAEMGHGAGHLDFARQRARAGADGPLAICQERHHCRGPRSFQGFFRGSCRLSADERS